MAVNNFTIFNNPNRQNELTKIRDKWLVKNMNENTFNPADSNGKYTPDGSHPRALSTGDKYGKGYQNPGVGYNAYSGVGAIQDIQQRTKQFNQNIYLPKKLGGPIYDY
jgi:hypothetical protein